MLHRVDQKAGRRANRAPERFAYPRCRNGPLHWTALSNIARSVPALGAGTMVLCVPLLDPHPCPLEHPMVELIPYLTFTGALFACALIALAWLEVRAAAA